MCVLHAASAFARVAVVPVWGVCSGESSAALKTLQRGHHPPFCPNPSPRPDELTALGGSWAATGASPEVARVSPSGCCAPRCPGLQGKSPVVRILQ